MAGVVSVLSRAARHQLISKCQGLCGGQAGRRPLLLKAFSRQSSRYSTAGSATQQWRRAMMAGTGAAAVCGMMFYWKREAITCSLVAKDQTLQAGARRSDLPDYRLADVENHKTKETGIWVTFNNGVYDITEFVEQHPGGTKILLAAGGALEPFWDLYAVHREETVFEMLEGLRIGNVNPADMEKKSAAKSSSNDPYANDPPRHPALQVNSKKPFNAEPPGELLIDNFITPNDLFFVRNHLPVPQVDENKYKLEIYIEGARRPVRLSLRDLKRKFKIHTVTATIQCAGNRRSEMSAVKKVKGLGWGGTAISNAEWTGVKLCDVLQYAGVDEEQVAHIQFEGLDKDVAGACYGASIPVETAMDPRRDVLLAFAMNGKDLPLDHGFPIRVVVPGTVGARQVKWLGKIVASKEESKSHWQQNDYKSFNPSIDWHNVDFSKSPAVQEYPVQGMICDPAPGAVLEHAEEVTVRGYAWSGGGRGIMRVDVSADGGETWQSANLHQMEQKVHRQWAWTLWEATIPIPKGHTGPVTLVCKAVDTACNAQSSSVSGIWNLRGLLNNAWHKVVVKVPET